MLENGLDTHDGCGQHRTIARTAPHSTAHLRTAQDVSIYYYMVRHRPPPFPAPLQVAGRAACPKRPSTALWRFSARVTAIFWRLGRMSPQVVPSVWYFI